MPAFVKLTPAAEKLVRQLQDEFQGIPGTLWAPKLAHCLTLFVEQRDVAASACFLLLLSELEAWPTVEATAVKLYRLLFHRRPNMACATTHKTSSTVQGPGVCCAALSASGLPPAVGVRVVAQNKLGKCIVCEVTTSRSPKHVGQLVFKRGKASVPGSSVSCPSTSEGCCALIGQ